MEQVYSPGQVLLKVQVQNARKNSVSCQTREPAPLSANHRAQRKVQQPTAARKYLTYIAQQHHGESSTEVRYTINNSRKVDRDLTHKLRQDRLSE
eukprot:scaffold57_cov149-Skeletonema_menzelii.AAC.7